MPYLQQDLDALWLAGDGGQVQGGASWKEEEEKRRVGGPMQASDSQGGKERDAQIIKGRLEREALSHMGPEIPVSQVPVYAVEVEGGKVYPAGREGNLWRVPARLPEERSRDCGGSLQQGPAPAPTAAVEGKASSVAQSHSPSSFLLLMSAPFASRIVRHSVRPLEAAR